MSQLLEQAIAQLKTLPTSQQDAIATLILAELEDERCWDESFARSPGLLAKLAAEAMDCYLHPSFIANCLSLLSFYLGFVLDRAVAAQF